MAIPDSIPQSSVDLSRFNKDGSPRKGALTPAERLWRRVTKTDKCWLWTGPVNIDGYGKMKVDKQHVGVHRLSWILANGIVPDGLQVLHRCDTPACVRVDHLFLGTTRDNMKDKVAKLRHARGERHGFAKLTNEQALAILRSTGSTAEVASQFGVCKNTVYFIRTGRHWAHLKG